MNHGYIPLHHAYQHFYIIIFQLTESVVGIRACDFSFGLPPLELGLLEWIEATTSSILFSISGHTLSQRAFAES